jgi:hypothetical protein
MDRLTLIVFGIVLVFMSIGKVAIVQADAAINPCPPGQVPVTNPNGDIITNPDGSPQCRATDALS